jgi:CubicO group peptidase (beta-lactamase class C family)
MNLLLMISFAKGLTLFAVLLFLMIGLSYAQQRKSPLNKIMESVFDETDPFNGVILMAKGGRVLVEESFGVRDFETGDKLKSSDIFELASVSKQFTAMVIIQLEAKGKLKFDDLVENYLSIPYKKITIRQLLNHTSGLPDYQAIMDAHWDKNKVADNNDIINYLNHYAPPANFLPGEKYEYSNTGYVLLASIAEKASGRDFTTMLREMVFKKFRMNDTDLRTLNEKKSLSNLAFGHMKPSGETRYFKADSFPSSNYTIWLGQREGPGRISSTAHDLLKWDRALYDGRFFTPEMKREAFKPAVLNNGSLSQYGFGWELGEDDVLGKYVQHSGDNPGYKTEIVRYIDADKTIILLCNNAHDRFEKLLDALKKHIASL